MHSGFIRDFSWKLLPAAAGNEIDEGDEAAKPKQ